jgi:HPt (histidine-containing phosphotransfer) domain-containing protein
LKGASANIGAATVARLAAEAEHGGASTERLARLEAALEAVRGFLRQRADGPGATRSARRTG